MSKTDQEIDAPKQLSNGIKSGKTETCKNMPSDKTINKEPVKYFKIEFNQDFKNMGHWIYFYLEIAKARNKDDKEKKLKLYFYR